MKPSHPNLRGAVVAAAAAVMLTATAQSAPKKPEPAPAIEQPAPPAKKGMFSKVKSALSFKKKEAAPAIETKAVEKAKPLEGSKSAPATKAKPAPKPVAPKVVGPEEPVATEKKGFFKKLLTREKVDAPVEPKLANAKTAKPAPVKEVKAGNNLALKPGEDTPKKHGWFGFLRGKGSKSLDGDGIAEVPGANKIVRPADWQEHRVVQDDEIALYTFGPSQALGPDERLPRGTLVKVKKVTKGWALVEVAGGKSGYMDASVLRAAEKNDFADPPAPAPAMAMASLSPEAWAPLPPPPDLPDQPGAMDNEGALLLLPPLELEPKKP